MDKQNVDKIITEYFRKIYGFAIKKSYSYDEAEDLCSEILKEVYISLLKAKEVINLEGYIWRISEHTYSKYVAHKKRHEGVSIDGLQIATFDDYSLENEEEIKRLRREVAFLNQKRREIVYRFYYENKPISVISKELGILEGTIKWHLNKARNELKEAFSMERKIGKLGLSPITALQIGHGGYLGSGGGPEEYLGDKLSLNIVYSVYHSPKTIEEIAEELGITPVFIEDKIALLENNGFLVKTKGERYTTFVWFNAESYSQELEDNKLKLQLEIARELAESYVPLVRKSVKDVKDVYIPSGNRELFEAAVVFYAISNKCRIPIDKDLSEYYIKTLAGGKYIAYVNTESKCSDPEYVSELQLPSYWACGDMQRQSGRYSAVYSWSIDSRYSSRKGGWVNNLTADYESIYQILTGIMENDPDKREKLERLEKRKFLTEDNKVNIMMVKGEAKEFFARIPALDGEFKERLAGKALEFAMQEAKSYPPQMQDLIVGQGVSDLIDRTVGLMVLDILYSNGTFKPLTENERVASNLLMFSDILP
ncbi:MAG: sigma-70 family RNA polymerase sigma factor [Ruminococcaceae bacterium]|nr:sigma-70 family RNA polymerase sigma factor [Oscillospiraceae bacterium]